MDMLSDDELVPDPVPRTLLIEPLTSRESEVLGLVCDGYSNQEIAELTGIGLPTVKYHISHIFGKLGVRRRTQAVAVAIHLRIAQPAWLFGSEPAAGAHARRAARTSLNAAQIAATA